jgi:aminopeptidase S
MGQPLESGALTLTGDSSMCSRGLTRRAVAAAASVLLVACATPAPPPTAVPTPTLPAISSFASASPTAALATPTATPEALNGDALASGVEAPALLVHLEALQTIADDHGGHRATGSAGFDASVAYVTGVLASAGYVVDDQPFEVGGVASVNLIAERPGVDDEVIMLGAHLDSVVVNPGINDNGSGVAALLVIAEQLLELPPPERTVRFAFWGAEEGGPFGSAAYVHALDPAERAHIVAYLNFDMLGSPNAVRFVYDEAGAAPGSSDLTELFTATLEEAGLAWEPIDLEGDSDHGAFAAAGIPTGGLFSGGIEPVTDAQAETFDARAGEPADPCSDRACDTIDNVDLATLEQMARIVARVMVALAVP